MKCARENQIFFENTALNGMPVTKRKPTRSYSKSFTTQSPFQDHPHPLKGN